MRNGIYRLHYETTTLCASAAVMLQNDKVSGCDRYYFIFGRYQRRGNQLKGSATFKRHTVHPNLPHGLIPEQFEVLFDGICGDDFGQFALRSREVPIVSGRASFTWLGDGNSVKDRTPIEPAAAVANTPFSEHRETTSGGAPILCRAG